MGKATADTRPRLRTISKPSTFCTVDADASAWRFSKCMLPLTRVTPVFRCRCEVRERSPEHATCCLPLYRGYIMRTLFMQWLPNHDSG